MDEYTSIRNPDAENNIYADDSSEELYVRLRKARQNRGWDVNQVADMLRLNPEIIQTIEDNQCDHTPAIFIHGYRRAYAQLMGIHVSQEQFDSHYRQEIEQGRLDIMPRKSLNQPLHKKRHMRLLLLLISIAIILTILITGLSFYSGLDSIDRINAENLLSTNADQSHEQILPTP